MLRRAALFLFLCSCSAADDAPTGPCSPHEGAFVVAYDEESGECGSLPDEIVVLPADASALPMGCTGSVSPARDLCSTVDNDVTCPRATGGSLKRRGTCKWSHDGRFGRCELQITLLRGDGSTQCTSIYSVDYKHQ